MRGVPHPETIGQAEGTSTPMESVSVNGLSEEFVSVTTRERHAFPAIAPMLAERPHDVTSNT